MAQTIPFTDGTPRCTTCHRAAHKPGTRDGHEFTTARADGHDPSGSEECATGLCSHEHPPPASRPASSRDARDAVIAAFLTGEAT